MPNPEQRRVLAASLPPNNAMRWTAVRKAQVVAAVAGGVLTLEEARQRYALSLEEFLSWQQSLARGDTRGVRHNRQIASSIGVAS
ncbi:MAG TPA: DUF1153 domain-containing protein [Rhizomicrobium sp.]|nr:DUF1153 domain-containing protein [Rhizomicrobium sp.]